MNLSQIQFGTKAETLERVQPFLKKFKVLPQVFFTVKEWRQNQPSCLQKIQNILGNHTHLIVRSSAKAEDSKKQSMAGVFDSVPNIPTDNTNDLKDAVERVICSFGNNALSDDQVLLQPFLEKVAVSGVVFTRDMDTLAPYYIINYDNRSGKTDKITSGCSNETETFIRYACMDTKAGRFSDLISALKELESLLCCDYLDVEFAQDTAGSLYLLQVRPIVIGQRTLPRAEDLGKYLNKIHKKVVKLNQPHPELHGRHTIFGVMPDWNPAEMIGTKPRTLSLSLYKELITDRTWAYQRYNYGYKNLRSYPLMVTFLGCPYVDARISFNSFIPSGLDEKLSERLCDHYLNCLLKNPHNHDKVEFDIVYSCYYFNIGNSLNKLKEHGFDSNDIQNLKASLLTLTNRILQKNSVFYEDLEKIEHLKTRQNKVIGSSLTDLEKIYWLVEDCKRYGTLPFAGLARAGFIAVQILKSFIEKEIFTQKDYDLFMSSLRTVAKNIFEDTHKLTQHDFLKRYGHLRPGTYDILSARYDESYDLYFSQKSNFEEKSANCELFFHQLNKIDAAIKEEGLRINAQGLIDFIKAAIEGREYAKFIFTKSVSAVLNLVKKICGKYGIGPEDASFIDIKTLLHLYATLDHRDLEEILTDEIRRNKHFYEYTKLIKLPPLISDANEVYEFHLETGTPNFITLRRCMCEVVLEEDFKTISLDGKIVFISRADPGYDWLFTKNIGGLVTMYGGANSHMAIRSAELKIPAVIGSGEKNFSLWSMAKILEIDCANKLVKVIRQ